MTTPTTTAGTTTTAGPEAEQGELLAAALAYAARGWHVLPLRPGSKRPAFPTHSASHCTGTDPRCSAAEGHLGWEQRATTDPERITRAWTARPYGIAIACGPSGLVVIDCDTPKRDTWPPEQWVAEHITCGHDGLSALAESRGTALPATYTVRTPSGGKHLYYTHPAAPGARLGNTAGTLGWLIDTRGHGGYVVAAPSRISGSIYTVLDCRSPVELPEWLATLLRPACLSQGQPSPTTTHTGDRSSAYLAAALAGETRRVQAAPVRQRNHTLFLASIALGQLVAGGALSEDQARTVLLDAAAPHLAAGAYSRAQAEATIRSGLRRGATRPRTLTGVAA